MPWIINQGSMVLWYPDNATVPIQARYYITQTIGTSITSVIYPIYSNIINNQTTTYTSTIPVWVNPMFSMQNMPLEQPIRHRPAAQAMDKYTVAENRARELLLRHLDREQKNDYENDKFFIVVARSRRRYRIETRGYSANILRIDDREVFCIHGDSSLPMSDHFLAQKLMIEFDEEEFLRIANRHGRRG